MKNKILILVGILIVLINNFNAIEIINHNVNYQDEKILKDNLILIPKIHLQTSIVLGGKDILKVIKNNVGIYYNSSMPNEKGSLILLAHSGNTKNAFFKDLDKLDIDDEIFIYFNSKCYYYIIKEILIVPETDIKYLENNHQDDHLVLITCQKGNNLNRLIVIAKKIT